VPVSQFDVEQVNLAVGGQDGAVGSQQQTGVEHIVGTRDLLVEGAGQQVDLQTAGQLAQSADQRRIQSVGQERNVTDTKEGEILGQGDQFGAAGAGQLHQPHGPIHVPLEVGARFHLDGGGQHEAPVDAGGTARSAAHSSAR